MLQCGAVRNQCLRPLLRVYWALFNLLQCVAVCCSVLQYVVAVCCSVLQCVAVCSSVLQRVAVCCSVLQCVAVCCSVHSISEALFENAMYSFTCDIWLFYMRDRSLLLMTQVYFTHDMGLVFGLNVQNLSSKLTH